MMTPATPSARQPATSVVAWLRATSLALAAMLSGPASSADTGDLIFAGDFEVPAPSSLALSDLSPADHATVSDAIALRISARFPTDGAPEGSVATLEVDGQDVGAAAISHAGTINYEPPQLLALGVHRITVHLGDLAGQWQFTTAAAPQISDFAPDGAHFVEGALPTISARFSDSASPIDTGSIALSIDGVDVTSQAQVDMLDAGNGSIRYTPAQPAAPGTRFVLLTVSNQRGLLRQSLATHYIDPLPRYTLEFDPLSAPATTQQAQIAVRLTAASNVAEVESVSVNGVDAEVMDYSVEVPAYVAELSLQPGPNPVEATVHFDNGETRSVTTTVQYDAPPTVVIDSPQDWQTFGPLDSNGEPVAGGATDLTGAVERPVTIHGRVSKPGTSVTVNQQQAQMDADGLGFSLPRYFLHEGTNLIGVAATDLSGRVGTAQITVYVDQTAPLLSIENPTAQAVTSAARVDVRGVANDAVEAGLHAPEPQVGVRNADTGATVSAEVDDRYYIARDVPLQIGANTLVVTATDAVGNTRSRQVQVVRVATGSGRVTAIGGDRQSAAVGSTLGKPLSVALLGADGSPLADRLVHFDVTRGSGLLAAGQGAATARNLSLRSDAQGLAQAWLTLGSEAQQSGNTVRAWSDGLAEDVVFTATATRGEARWVIVDGATSYQFAPTNGQPVDALTAIVFDAERNPLAGAPVVFVVDAGDAYFTAQSAPGATLGEDGLSITVGTDKHGRAAVRPWLGIAPGTVKIRAQAVLDDGTRVGAAVFQLGVLERRDGPTGFSGVVLDHTGAPLPGVRLSIARTSLSSVSDAQGRFLFDDQVPPGKIDLFVDGRDVQVTRNGVPLQYPALHFEAAAVQGQRNELPHPIYLPPINLATARVVGGDADVSLTIPGVEGFEMIVKAHSVTFPDGSREGPLVVTPVNSDRLPMVPPGGTGKFGAVAWTLQPTGTRFDPPIEVRLPNPQGMKPGETAAIVQWDHDLAAFVPMGRGTVSEDGTQLISDPGSGITKAGWGGCVDCPQPPPTCGTNPPPPVCPARADGTRADCEACPSCQKPDPQQCLKACIPDATQKDRQCQGNACKRCDNAGHCKTKYSEDKPAGVQQISYDEPEPQSILDGGNKAHFSGYQGAPETPATWTFEITPYCTKEGKWKFVLSKANIHSIIARHQGYLFIEMTDAIVDEFADGPTSPLCRLYDSAEFTLKWSASTHYPGGPPGNPAVSALQGQHFGGFAHGENYDQWAEILAHETQHFHRFKHYVGSAWQDFLDGVDALEAPMDACPTPERAKQCVAQRFKNLVIQLGNSAGQEQTRSGGPDDHTPADDFYGCSSNAMSDMFSHINARREAHQCATTPVLTLSCP